MKKPPSQFLVQLNCGCKRRTRDEPPNRKFTFACPSNVGHGYRIGWSSVTCMKSGRTTFNSPPLEGS